MKKLLLVLAFLFVPSIAWAQCTGVFPPNTSCGNFTGSPAPPSAQAIGVGTVTTGSANQMPFYKTTGANVSPTSTLPAGFDLTGGWLTHDQQPNGNAPVWNRLGVAIDPSVTNCGSQNSAQERGMLYEGSPQILTSYTSVFKMWYSTGFSQGTVSYAESGDGVNWTCYTGNPIITGSGTGVAHVHSVVKSGSTYNLYPINLTTGAVDRYTSTNGVTFALANSSVVSPTAGWEGAALFNPFVWTDTPGNLKMIYSGAGPAFDCGLATSTDGITWTKSGSNPVIADGKIACGPYIQKVGSTYYMWTQAEDNAATNQITDLYLYTSSNLTSWTRAPTNCVFCRATKDEGFNNQSGQTADPTIVEVGGNSYLYYVATPDQSHFKIKVAIADMPVSSVVTTSQSFFPVTNAGYGSPLPLGRGPNGEKQNFQYVFGTTAGGWGFRGYNVSYGSTGAIISDVPGETGFWERVEVDTSNTAAQWVEAYRNAAGSDIFVTGADMTAGGANNHYYVFGGSTHFCMNTTTFGSCGQNLQPWAGNTGFQVNQNDGDGAGDGGMRFARLQQREMASPGSGSSQAEHWDDSTAHRPKFNYNSGPDLTLPGIVGSGTVSTSGTVINSGACGTQIIAATGVVSSDVINWSFQGALGSGWPNIHVLTHTVSGSVNFDFCNASAANTSPAAMSLNWMAVR